MDGKYTLEDQIGSYSNDQPQNQDKFASYQTNDYGSNPTQSESPSKPEPQQQQSGCMRFFNLQFYEKFFKVSQQQVIQRVTLAFIPIKREFIEKIRPNPDFYGPFWVLTTIIFLLSSTGNLSRYFSNWQRDQYIFQLQLVRYGVVIVYSFGFGVPVLLYFVMKFLGSESFSLPQLICIYGYSFACFLAVFLLCILPWGWLHWLLMVYGMINSIAFLILNMAEHMDALGKQGMYVVFGIIGLAQIALFLTFKLVFFNLIYESADQ